ncbi:vibriobactin synthetase [Vibrio nigripulchritudo]|uniref:condensation domain-containing protein n=1 Tax=Vibrio nigripulchritudo TaxID=28173 RepID=UPI00190E4907|nr:condensation domain-containing protein [Vibrio nigripulchritudo]BCL72236.1 vibriobactin synthetase [Vibrio nigripulchritudo]BDU33595.1 vibriobactin synthetase [Vibrio nigripulchritudo]
MIRQEWHPLTNAQQSYWDEYLQHPDKPFSNVAHCLEISGNIDIEKLHQAVQMAFSEAEVLKLKFKNEEGSAYPLQSLESNDSKYVELTDLRSFDDAEKRATKAMETDALFPLNLEKDAISQLQLFVLADDRVWWYIRTHHIAVDGYGMNLIEQRCALLYSSLVNGQKPHSGFKSLDTYLKEDSDYRFGERFEVDKQFWESYLSETKLTRNNSEEISLETHSDDKQIPQAITATLLSLSKKLMIGWTDILVLLISAYLYEDKKVQSKNDEPFPVWLPFMNRMGNSCANTPSLMVNIIPFLVSKKANEGVEEYLKRAAKEIRQLYIHGRFRLENKVQCKEQSYFLSPFINILPFDSPEFIGCQTKHRIVASGLADGFNITVRSARDATNMSLKVEGENRLYSQEEITRHSDNLLKYISKVLEV